MMTIPGASVPMHVTAKCTGISELEDVHRDKAVTAALLRQTAAVSAKATRRDAGAPTERPAVRTTAVAKVRSVPRIARAVSVQRRGRRWDTR